MSDNVPVIISIGAGRGETRGRYVDLGTHFDVFGARLRDNALLGMRDTHTREL